MAQFVPLQNKLKAFHEAGVGVVALTYDAPGLQQAFIDKNAMTYHFLSDADAHLVTALGILNEGKEPGSDHYSIPQPGIFIINSGLQTVGEISVQGYETRVDTKAVLSYAKGLL